MLARIRKAMEDKDEGFTLIELLVVVIIIGILAAIAIPVFLNQRQKAVQAGMKSDLRSVADEEETYFVDNQNYVAPSAVANKSLTVGSDKVSISDANTSMVAVPLASDGTKAASYTGAAGYCLTASNSGFSTKWYYNSVNGGVTSTACPT